MTRRNPPVETDAYAQFMARVVAAHARRVAAGDIAALAGLKDLRRQVDDALIDAVRALRSEQGGAHSWSEIGRQLGITAQGAEKRFGAKVGPGARKPGGQPTRLR